MPYLYVTDSSCKLGFRAGLVIVANPASDCEVEIPFSRVEGISIFGMSQVSTKLIRECISADIPILYYSENGHYFGSINSSNHIDPILHRKQMLLMDDASFCLEWSKSIVSAKIANSMTLLKSYSGMYVFKDSELQGLNHSLGMLPMADSLNMILGLEGNAAKNYFSLLPRLIRGEEFVFKGRSSRPPKDPFNSMLSFGYSILFRNIIGAIERHGLHPYFAFMHRLKLGHAALASDLIEEYRAPIVDKTVLDLVNGGELDVSGFYRNDAGAIYMDRRTMGLLTDALSDAIAKNRHYYLAWGDRKAYGFQVMLDKKLAALKAAIEAQDVRLYKPFIWKPEDGVE